MRRLILGTPVPLLCATVALACFGARAAAQVPAPVKVNFESEDKVNLRGTFYPSTQGKKANTVLLLHDTGSDRSKGWDKLAAELQKRDFAVLAFDFRGHGESKAVDAEFWNNAFNQRFVKGYSATKPKDTIEHKDFAKNYYSSLINDITAAKAFLDRRNDQGDCNSANLIVIGAGDGAVLGAMWIYEEQFRHRAIG